MTRDETTALLRVRSGLTSQPYSEDVADAWHDALCEWTFNENRRAMILASRDATRVTIANLVAHLPQRERTPAAAPGPACELCDGTGWVESPPERAHRPSVCTPRPAKPCTCNPTDERPCNCNPTKAIDCHCHAVEPCRCTTGRRATDVHRSIVEHNDRTRRTDLLEGDPPPDTLRHWSEREPDPELF